jgi:hypothetical protein
MSTSAQTGQIRYIFPAGWYSTHDIKVKIFAKHLNRDVTETFFFTYVLSFRNIIYIHTYHSRFIPAGVAESSEMFLRDAHALNYLPMSNTADMALRKPYDRSLSQVQMILIL